MHSWCLGGRPVSFSRRRRPVQDGWNTGSMFSRGEDRRYTQGITTVAQQKRNTQEQEHEQR